MRTNLKSVIEIRGESVATVAVAVGVQPAQISRIIHNHIEASPDLRRRIAERLGADERWLFRDLKRVPPFVQSGRKRNPEQSAKPAEAANAR